MKKITNNENLILAQKIRVSKLKGESIFNIRIPFKLQYAINRTIDRIDAEEKRIQKLIEKYKPKELKEGQKYMVTGEALEILNAESELNPYMYKEKLNIDDLEITALEFEILELVTDEGDESGGMPEGPDPT